MAADPRYGRPGAAGDGGRPRSAGRRSPEPGARAADRRRSVTLVPAGVHGWHEYQRAAGAPQAVPVHPAWRWHGTDPGHAEHQQAGLAGFGQQGQPGMAPGGLRRRYGAESAVGRGRGPGSSAHVGRRSRPDHRRAGPTPASPSTPTTMLVTGGPGGALPTQAGPGRAGRSWCPYFSVSSIWLPGRGDAALAGLEPDPGRHAPGSVRSENL